ncbi:MAG: exopolyphosphatase, partial [Xanthomonadales bacterium]|nr:exopolyphosphatase [Xanthomonadales bacterium]
MSATLAGAPLAVVDLGSNSFHLLVARASGASFEAIEHQFDNVRLAAGVNALGQLDDAHRQHALATLSHFARHIADLPAARVHAVATHAVRELRDPAEFLRPAAAALGHPIDVISGAEEARLIWLGVAGALPTNAEKRLVIDIGGGSTEFILGHGHVMDDWHSASMGCVTAGVQCFADGELTAERWHRCQVQLRQNMQSFATRFSDSGWQHAYATSGSAQAI